MDSFLYSSLDISFSGRIDRLDMTLLNRIKFAFKYDIESEYIVFDFKGQQAMRFLEYEDARKFSEEQVEYLPNVLIAIKAKRIDL